MKSGGDSSRRDRDDDSGSRPDEPTNWRDMVRTGYDYPDEIDQLSWRERRRAKRTWRRDDHAQRVAWLRQQRQAEPSSPVTVVVAVVILAIIVLGLGGGLPRLLRGDEPPTRGDVGVLTPSRPPDEAQSPSAPQSTTTPSSPATLQNSTPPILTEHPPAAATTAATTTLNAWARVFYTRDPSSETYADLIDKSAAYITTELGESLQSEGDSTYDALKSDGGRSTVTAVKVEMPKPESAPVDTPTRITRLVSVTIDVTGKRPNRMVLPLLITLVPEGSSWVISDLNGGTGP
ncbi:hypothetical protein EV137_1748 [Kribbella pratensis]|uniref:Mce-associated membrane protein n=1 Tax=Kribbella pratensis TaxID=2512112 RepID=A0ABY2FMU1_9ACTN|nr:hypothetical protein [Kribbella pratensis]TDW94441.1 hypothetical protein EV137_1748 [Kribbella pratensis]